MSEQEPIGTRDWDKEHWRQAALQTEQVSEGFKYRNRSLQARIRELEAEVEKLKLQDDHHNELAAEYFDGWQKALIEVERLKVALQRAMDSAEANEKAASGG